MSLQLLVRAVYVIVGSFSQTLIYHAFLDWFAVPVHLTYGHIYALVAIINAHSTGHQLITDLAPDALTPRELLRRTFFLQLGIVIVLLACLVVGELAGWAAGTK